MQRMHDGDAQLPHPIGSPNSQPQLNGLPCQALRFDPFHIPQEIDFDRSATHDGAYDRGLGRVVIGIGYQQFAVQGLRKFLSGLPITEIIDIFRGIGAVSGQAFNFAVMLSPQIERLATDDKGTIAKLEDLCQIVDDFRRQRRLGQEKTSLQAIEESRTSSEEKKPLLTRRSSRET